MGSRLSPPIIVVGAGFAGAVYARELAQAGYRVQVVEQRPHIAGNAYDEIAVTGQRIHRYGPHLFHTSNKSVVDWITQFGTFLPYEHRVQALLPGGSLVPLPVNRLTINAVFNVQLGTQAEVEAFLADQAVVNETPANAAEYLASKIGVTLTDLFFRPYTRKMWELDLEDLDAAVVKRIPLRYDDEDRYFPTDTYQMLPEHGYTKLFEAILDHPNISVQLGQKFDKSMLSGTKHCFNSMPIDEFFDNVFGPLPYRSIRFHHTEQPADYNVGTAATINYTDRGPLTRETDWSRLAGHQLGGSQAKTITREEPCDYRDNDMERYYPVKTSDGRYDAAYEQYKKLAAGEAGLTFIGRCGTYQYLDMHQVINQSLAGVRAWLLANPASGEDLA